MIISSDFSFAIIFLCPQLFFPSTWDLFFYHLFIFSSLSHSFIPSFFLFFPFLWTFEKEKKLISRKSAMMLYLVTGNMLPEQLIHEIQCSQVVRNHIHCSVTYRLQLHLAAGIKWRKELCLGIRKPTCHVFWIFLSSTSWQPCVHHQYFLIFSLWPAGHKSYHKPFYERSSAVERSRRWKLCLSILLKEQGVPLARREKNAGAGSCLERLTLDSSCRQVS